MKTLEIEANQFAMAILMPESFIKEQLTKFIDKDYEETITEMAKIFDVTKERMAARLTQLNLMI